MDLMAVQIEREILEKEEWQSIAKEWEDVEEEE